MMRVSYFPHIEGRRGTSPGEIDILVPAEGGAFDARYQARDGRAVTSNIPGPMVCLVPPNRQMELECTRPSDMVVMSMNEAFVSEQQRIRLDFERTSETSDPFFRRLGNALRAGFRVRRPPTPEYLSALAHAVAAHMRQAYSHPALARGLPTHKVERVRALVAAAMGSSMHVDHMAAAVGLSPFHFARMFKDATGEAPHAYLTRMRIQEAKRLLSDTSLALADIAQRVGFRTQAHFTGVFHKHASTTPRAFRLANRTKQP
ncbi:MAG TPA: helix-turn-helix transcriptional regulator [Usitatibacter sp.]|nr:helix-turn-helix transcriptional regulator [Usitatibacter sp.]